MRSTRRLTVGSLGAIIPVFAMAGIVEASGLDLALQDRFFDPAGKQWLIDARSAGGRFFFYTGPKFLLASFAGCLIALLVGPESWRQRTSERGWFASRKHLFCVLACAAGIPLTVSFLKATSGVFCPSELQRYGGSAPYRSPFAPRAEGEPSGRCWPAGHASGGFALLALLPASRDKRRVRQVTYLGLAAGFLMGGYQMLKGAHFLSHTLVTLGIAMSFVAIGGALLKEHRKAHPS